MKNGYSSNVKEKPSQLQSEVYNRKVIHSQNNNSKNLAGKLY